jgi:hypothetical protein
LPLVQLSGAESDQIVQQRAAGNFGSSDSISHATAEYPERLLAL